MSIFEQIANEIGQTIGTPTNQTWYACQSCYHSYQSPELLRSCPKCLAPVNQWMGDNEEQALKRARMANGVAPSTPILVVESRAVVDPDCKITAQLLPASDGAAQNVIVVSANATSTSAPASKAKIRVKKEKTAPIEAPVEAPVEAKVEQTADEPAEELSADEKKAERLAKIQEYAKAHNLNGISPTMIGTATVQTHGFTMWQDKKPVYRFLEPHEEIADFNAEFNMTRAMQPMTQIDVIRCANCSDPALHDLLFSGNIIAGLNAGRGNQFVKRNQTVKLGALISDSGYLRFIVLGVA